MKKHNDQPRIEPRFSDNSTTSACDAQVEWSWKKSLFISVMYLVAIIGGILTFSIQNLVFFLAVTAIVLCLGHSLGMHRLLIHRSYECPKWMEYVFVYLGSLVGLGGPFTMVYTHDMRDWAQRKARCHDYFSHQQSFFKDAYWQMHCDIKLKHMPTYILEPDIRNNKFYIFIEKTVLFQQILLACIFYLIGGIGFVIWGVACRVAISVTGHWLIGHFAHKKGHQDWVIQRAGVQGYNIKFCGLITFGECWHNNHHAFPGSARLGIDKNQSDPGWWVLLALRNLGLVWNIHLPQDLPFRASLTPVHQAGAATSV